MDADYSEPRGIEYIMISGTKFRNIFGPAIFLSAILIFFYLSGMVSMAFPVTGVGGFTIEASSVSGNDLHIYPSMDDTDKTQEHPVAIIESRSMSLEGFKIVKDFNFDNFADVGTGTMRIIIRSNSSQTTDVDTAVVRTVSMQASDADMEDLTMQEHYVPTGSNPLGPSDPIEFTTSADSYSLQNLKIQASSMAAEKVNIPGLELIIQFDPDNDGTFEFS